jgi:CDP-paratose synthetase
MKIFITGATGFIGRHLVEELNKFGHNVTINLLTNEISPFHLNNTFILGDKDIVECIQFFEQEAFDGVIHLASFVKSGEHQVDEVDLLIDSNIKFAVKLLEVSFRAKVKWFINTGTYWQNYKNEDYSPVNLYAATKQAFEDIAKFYIESNKIKFCTIRLFDTFGPGDPRPKIFNIWDRIAKTQETLEMSPGEQIIDISYIDDIVCAFILLAQHLENNHPGVVNGAVYAVKAEKRYSLKELALLFEETTKQKLNINWGGRPYRENEVMIPWINANVVPEWKPKISISEGIKRLKFKN